MFTGIIEELGRVKGIRRQAAGVRIDIAAAKVFEGTSIGDSIAVNGVCLTVVAAKDNTFSFDAIPKTVSLTTLKDLVIGGQVNLERALKMGDRLGGHFVTGHVDCIGIIRSKASFKGELEFRIAVPPRFLKFLILKGSVAVDGISLTLADIRGPVFAVCVIPHTASVTTLGKTHSGGKVNVEFDMLVKSRG